MKRGVVLLALVTLGAFSLVVAGYQGPPAGPSAAALQATKIEKVKDNLYIITGSSDPAAFSGGNTAVFITDAGVGANHSRSSQDRDEQTCHDDHQHALSQ
jgi:hypothetical protein